MSSLYAVRVIIILSILISFGMSSRFPIPKTEVRSFCKNGKLWECIKGGYNDAERCFVSSYEENHRSCQ